MSGIRLQAAKRGLIIISKTFKEAYGIQPGDALTLLDLGGVIVLTPVPSEIDTLANRIAAKLQDRDETLESMLQALREEREWFGSS